MMDGPKDPHLRKAVETAAKQGKVISAVCHGPAGLVSAELDGKPVVRGKKVRGYMAQPDCMQTAQTCTVFFDSTLNSRCPLYILPQLHACAAGSLMITRAAINHVFMTLHAVNCLQGMRFT